MSASVSFNSLFSKGSSLLHLWSYSDDELMSNLSRDPTTRRSKPSLRVVNSKSFHFSKIPIGNRDTHGGLYGPKLILQTLCRDWQSIFSTAWYLPPFLPKIPSQGVNGITVEVMTGLSIETALRWGLSSSSTSSVYFPKLKPKKPKGAMRSSSSRTKSQPFEKLVREPPSEMIFTGAVYSDDSEDEDTATGEDGVDSSAHDGASESTLVQECPWGQVHSLGKVSLEVVFKYCHDVPSQTTAIRELFVNEVEGVVHSLSSSSNSNWTLSQIRIPSSSTSSPDEDTKVLTFPLSRLRAGEKNFTKSFQKRLWRVGLCWLDGVVLLIDQSQTQSGVRKGKHNGSLSFEKFLNVNNEVSDDGGDEEEATDPSSHLPGTRIQKPAQDWLGNEMERIVRDLTASNEIKRLLQSIGKVFVPISLRFNLLSWVRGLEVAGAARHQHSEALLSAEKKQLTIGKPETIARLVSSTLWMTEEGAKHVWSCCQQRQSLVNCYSFESRRHLLSARQLYQQGRHLEAYERLCLSIVLSQQTISVLPPPDSVAPAAPILSSAPSTLTSTPPVPASSSDSTLPSSPYQRLTIGRIIPNVLRMRHGLPGLTQDILNSISAVKDLFHSATDGATGGGGFGSIDLLSLAFTITRHICYKTRLVLMSSQCLHHSGGCTLILLKLKHLEELLHLGHWKLVRMGQPIDPNHSMKKLQKSESNRRSEEEENPLPWALPEYIPRTSVGVAEVVVESSRGGESKAWSYASSASSEQQQIEYDFSQVLSSAAVVIQNQPHRLLSEIGAYLSYLSLSLSRDVHNNATRDNEELSLVLSAKEIDSSLQKIINQRIRVEEIEKLTVVRTGGGRGHQQGPASLRAIAAATEVSGLPIITCRFTHPLTTGLSPRPNKDEGSEQMPSLPTRLSVVSSRASSVTSTEPERDPHRREISRGSDRSTEERLLTGVSVSSVLSMNEGPYSSLFSF
jgi:hypothetical protein